MQCELNAHSLAHKNHVFIGHAVARRMAVYHGNRFSCV